MHVCSHKGVPANTGLPSYLPHSRQHHGARHLGLEITPFQSQQDTVSITWTAFPKVGISRMLCIGITPFPTSPWVDSSASHSLKHYSGCWLRTLTFSKWLQGYIVAIGAKVEKVSTMKPILSSWVFWNSDWRPVLPRLHMWYIVKYFLPCDKDLNSLRDSFLESLHFRRLRSWTPQWSHSGCEVSSYAFQAPGSDKLKVTLWLSNKILFTMLSCFSTNVNPDFLDTK